MDSFLSGNLFSKVDKGKKREQNEDFAGARVNAFGQLILVVADGMGGKNRGDYASNILGNGLIDAFLDVDKPFYKPKQINKWLYKHINSLNRDLYRLAKENPEYKGMGTTLTVAVNTGKYLVVAQVGDSRLYILNQRRQIEQLTVDQSYVQYLKHKNQITESDISIHPERHKLTNAIGTRFNALVDIKEYEYHGETLLLCSDGLYNNVPLHDLQSILKSSESPERKCYQLIAFGNANGGSDNMAVVIWESN